MSDTTILLFSTVRILVSLAAAVMAVSVYRMFKGGVMEAAWPIFSAAAILQALAGVGEIIDAVAGYEFAGELIERSSDIASALLFLWFIFNLRHVWRRAAKY